MKKLFAILILSFVVKLAYSQEYFNSDTTYIMAGKKYHLSTRDLGEDQDNLLLTVTSSGKSILKCQKDKVGGGWILEDFDGDGYPDITYSYYGNNTVYELLLFSPQTNKYIEVKDFIHFPEALPLKNKPNYYYSYHRAGCADMNWVSDLFKIENYKAIHLGEIYGQGCEHEDDIPKIDIFKILNNDEKQKKLLRTMSFDDKYFKDTDSKWDFIKKYWNQYYHLFK